MFRSKTFLATLALAMGLSLAVADHAEAKRGFSFGSRGSRTYQAPPPTNTAPSAAPIQRSTTPQTAPSAASRPQTGARPSMFGQGLGGALMRGLLIGGLVGLLMGNGLGGLAGILGLLLQVGLIVLGVMLVLRLLRGPQPVPAGGPRYGSGGGHGGGHVPPVAGGAHRPPPSQGAAPSGSTDEVGITGADLDTFERLLATVQTSFAKEDEGALFAVTTPEVFAFLKSEVEEGRQSGVRNEVSDVKLLQGDLAEAWREGDREYATVAMRYESRDRMVDRATGQILSGDREGLGQSTEVWTFVRERGGDWKLAAIQGT